MLEDTTELIRVDAHDIHVASLQWIIDIAAFHVDLHMIRILSSDGRTVYFDEMSSPVLQVELSDFGPEGLYYLQLIGPEGGIRAVRKVIRK